MLMIRLEAKPQGATFTGTVEPSLAGGGSTWSLYKTDSGRRCWWAVTDAGRGSWWEEKSEEVRNAQVV